MAERGWAAIDARARETKRSVFAETKRGLKIARERVRNAGTAALNLGAKLRRRLGVFGRRIEHQVYRYQDSKKRLDTYRAEWAVERELARIVSGSEPLIVGPWLSEVGYEALYWVPFLRWVQMQFRIKPERMVVVTRGGASAWYRDITTRSVELFDFMTPEEYAQGNARRSAEGSGTVKQWLMSPMDEEVLSEVRRRIDAPSARVLHPSIMYRLLHYFWLGHRPQSFLDRRTRYKPIAPPAVELPPLPEEFIAVKFYSARTLPPTEPIKRALQSIVFRLAEKSPVVMLDTGLPLDDHADYSFDIASRIHSVRDALRPADNLAVQTAIIARARSFVGTCGSVAWLAPMLGVDTTAVLADTRFLHGHLQVGRRVYQLLGGGRFSPLDLSALDQLGMTLTGRADRSPAEAGHYR